MQDLLHHMADIANKYKDDIRNKDYQEEIKRHANHIVKSLDDKDVIKLLLERVENLTRGFGSVSKNYREELTFGIKPEDYWSQQKAAFTGVKLSSSIFGKRQLRRQSIQMKIADNFLESISNEFKSSIFEFPRVFFKKEKFCV